MPNLPPVEGARSQVLTCDAVETVLVDRKTLEEIYWNLTRAVDEIGSIRLHQQFVTIARFFVSGIRGRQAEKITLFLDKWFEYSPGELKRVEAELSQAQRVSQMLLAVSKMGGE